MKSAKWILMMTLTLLPGLAAAQLRSSDKIVAQAPFEFMVGNQFVPAGQCAIRSIDKSGAIATILVSGDHVGVLARATLGETKQAAGKYALVFNRYGDHYFLTGIKLAGDKTVYTVSESKAEAELRAQNVPAVKAVLLASLK